MRRPLGTAVLLLLVGAVLAVLGAGGAQAAGYRYWSFWEGDGGKGWTYATQGPSLVRPDDGAVQGFRFSVSEDSQDSAQPRRAPDFGTVCADTPAKDGRKRVAVVIDPGTPADAPDGEKPPALRAACALVALDASTAEALASVAKPLRYDSAAMLCAISGYPRSGCGEQVADGGSDEATGAAEPSAAPGEDTGAAGSGDGGGPSAGVLAGVGAVLVLGLAAVLRARRRR
ncbi:SCO2322 family protein [Streptomyces sp. NBC_01341]|uniref:SCO2322 family protein n=1 Tax=Streptomyces sp. NBC_01341 TaxID=2903831 RepID=UPI002E141983|nr:SCO2322 family protein [Streptomyces sp. NBC_01341]